MCYISFDRYIYINLSTKTIGRLFSVLRFCNFNEHKSDTKLRGSTYMTYEIYFSVYETNY